jgi:aquaporin Z
MEAAGLGAFMVSACVFGAAFEHPSSPVRQAIANPFSRRALMGMAMGLTAIAIILSPWGKQSGAHLNPSVTLTFLRLGKITPIDASFYILFQFAGGIAGVLLAATFLRNTLTHPAVNCVATLPGPSGAGLAFLAETLISFILMTVILVATNTKSVARFTGLFAGALVATYITFEAPISGMSMNPARTLGSGLSAHAWNSLWVYFTAPPLGMLLAAEVYTRLGKSRNLACPKLHHNNGRRCIFCGSGCSVTTSAVDVEMESRQACVENSFL